MLESQYAALSVTSACGAVLAAAGGGQLLLPSMVCTHSKLRNNKKAKGLRRVQMTPFF